MPVLETLQALPAGGAGSGLGVASLCRVLSHTPEGRAHVAAFAGRVAELLGGSHTAWIQGRAETAVQAGEWQASFEAGGDAANALAYALHQELPPLGFRPSFEVQEARHAEITELSTRLLVAVVS